MFLCFFSVYTQTIRGSQMLSPTIPCAWFVFLSAYHNHLMGLCWAHVDDASLTWVILSDRLHSWHLCRNIFSAKQCLPYTRIKDSSGSRWHFSGNLLVTLVPPLDNTAMKMPSQQAKIAHFHYGETTVLLYRPFTAYFHNFLETICSHNFSSGGRKYVFIQVHTYSYTYILNKLEICFASVWITEQNKYFL